MFRKLFKCFSCVKQETEIFIIENNHYFENSNHSKNEITNTSSNKDNEITHILQCYDEEDIETNINLNTQNESIIVSNEIFINPLMKTESINYISKINENKPSYKIKIKKTNEVFILDGKNYPIYVYKNGPKFIKLSIDKN